VVEVRLAPGDGRRLAELHRGAEVIAQAMDDETGELRVSVRASSELLARLGLDPATR
jgi:hypothetical protein